MVFNLLATMVAFLTISCGHNLPDYEMNNVLKPYLDEFYKEAQARNVEIGFGDQMALRVVAISDDLSRYNKGVPLNGICQKNVYTNDFGHKRDVYTIKVWNPEVFLKDVVRRFPTYYMPKEVTDKYISRGQRIPMSVQEDYEEEFNELYEASKDLYFRIVMFHEAGHCLLNSDHRPPQKIGEVMRFEIMGSRVGGFPRLLRNIESGSLDWDEAVDRFFEFAIQSEWQ
jgi:hypothetical protein